MVLGLFPCYFILSSLRYSLSGSIPIASNSNLIESIAYYHVLYIKHLIYLIPYEHYRGETMIDRKKLVTRHNPVLHAADVSSPLTVGNGGFAYTADVTGFQTLYDHYAGMTPLCTMSDWGWHRFPGYHTLTDLAFTEYMYNGRQVRYAVERKPGNESVYDWLRQNPHRLNLGRIALYLDGREIAPARITGIQQTLDLWEGVLYSDFRVEGMACHAVTACAPDEDTLAFSVTGEAAESGRLSVCLAFPYASPGITASDWEAVEKHVSELNGRHVTRRLDDTEYTVTASCGIERLDAHGFKISELVFSLRFSQEGGEPMPPMRVFDQSRGYWGRFWSSGGAIELIGSTDKRAHELERAHRAVPVLDGNPMRGAYTARGNGTDLQ
jgi:hypothetical protein